MATEIVSSINMFTVPDYIVFGLFMLSSIAIGIFFACYRGGQHTTRDYFLGDRKLRVLPVALSYVVTFQSSILVLGFPAEAYAYGMQYSMNCVGVVAAYLLATVIVVPLFHPLKITSVYEYFQLRYGNNIVRFLAVCLGIVYYTLYMGIVLYGTSLALQSAAGLPFWSTLVVFASAAALYTSIGGIKAVIWTDVFQTIVMIAGITAVLVKTTAEAGGSANVFNVSRSRFNFFDFNPDPTERHTFWTLSIGAFMQFIYVTLSQASIQRMNSTPTLKTAKHLFYIAAPVYSFIWILSMFQGVTIYAYFSEKGCDPLASGQVSNLNQIIPYTVMKLFHDLPGIPGLFIAALAAASLSTISSGLSSLAAVAYADIIKIKFPSLKEEIGTNISKVVVVLYAIIAIGFAFLASNVKGPITQLFVSFVGAVGGSSTGLFLLSIFNHRATTKGAVTGTLCAIGFIMWLSLGQNFSGSVGITPYLPLGPTAQCPKSNSTFADTGILWYTNSSQNNQTHNISVPEIHTSTTATADIERRSGLSVFYSISYMYFDFIGVIIVLIVGSFVSMFTQPKVSEKTNPKCVLPFSVLVPGFIKNCWFKCMKRNKKPQTANELEEEMVPMQQHKHINENKVFEK